MLMTISHSKAGRLQLPGADASLRWRDLFRGNEDLLTGVVFGRFRFLSEETLQQVMGLLIGEEQAVELGTLVDLEFWPSLTGLTDRSRVEPDVLFTFENAVVLVEVKPPFGGGQHIQQWRNEIRAFVADCTNGEREYPTVLHFVALGRNRNDDFESHGELVDTRGIFELFIHLREWDIFWRWLANLTDDFSTADRAVFADWRDAFELFGLGIEAPKPWLPLCTWMSDNQLSIDPALWVSSPKIIRKPPTPGGAIDWLALAKYSELYSLEMTAWT